MRRRFERRIELAMHAIGERQHPDMAASSMRLPSRRICCVACRMRYRLGRLAAQAVDAAEQVGGSAVNLSPPPRPSAISRALPAKSTA